MRGNGGKRIYVLCVLHRTACGKDPAAGGGDKRIFLNTIS